VRDKYCAFLPVRLGWAAGVTRAKRGQFLQLTAFGYLTAMLLGTAFLLAWSVLLPLQYVYQKVSMQMVTRIAQGGGMRTMKATLYFTADGKMASHYTEPEPFLVTNNTKGEIMMYDFGRNTVTRKQNYLLNTESNQLFFFLEKSRADMGLAAMGFRLTETKFAEGLKITVWTPPMQLAKDISKVELAHDKGNPVFLGYFDQRGKAISKMYLYQYQYVAGIQFPAAVSQISHISDADSIVSKTQYSNFKSGGEVDETYLRFQIPANAKVVQAP